MTCIIAAPPSNAPSATPQALDGDATTWSQRTGYACVRDVIVVLEELSKSEFQDDAEPSRRALKHQLRVQVLQRFGIHFALFEPLWRLEDSDYRSYAHEYPEIAADHVLHGCELQGDYLHLWFGAPGAEGAAVLHLYEQLAYFEDGGEASMKADAAVLQEVREAGRRAAVQELDEFERELLKGLLAKHGAPAEPVTPDDVLGTAAVAGLARRYLNKLTQERLPGELSSSLPL
jgi:hypothetical protein